MAAAHCQRGPGIGSARRGRGRSRVRMTLPGGAMATSTSHRSLRRSSRWELGRGRFEESSKLAFFAFIAVSPREQRCRLTTTRKQTKKADQASARRRRPGLRRVGRHSELESRLLLSRLSYDKCSRSFEVFLYSPEHPFDTTKRRRTNDASFRRKSRKNEKERKKRSIAKKANAF